MHPGKIIGHDRHASLNRQLPSTETTQPFASVTSNNVINQEPGPFLLRSDRPLVPEYASDQKQLSTLEPRFNYRRG